MSGEGKWRPTLPMITAGVISMVLALAVAGFGVVRVSVDLPAFVEIVIAAFMAALGAFGIGALFVRTISRPLRELVERADHIARGDTSAIGPLTRHGTQELASLTESFMGMALTLSKRSDYLRTFARHVSHELRTPLTAIRGAAELLADEDNMTPAEQRRLLGIVLAEVARMNTLLERLSEQARADNPDLGGSTTLETVFATLRMRFERLSIDVRGPIDRPLAISEENAGIIFSHLLDNAVRHGARCVDIEAKTVGDFLSVSVADDGAGVSEGNRSRVFDPFFTTRRDDGGTGMGLAIVRSLIEAHGGTVALAEAKRGARFVLTAPLRSTPRRAAARLERAG